MKTRKNDKAELYEAVASIIIGTIILLFLAPNAMTFVWGIVMLNIHVIGFVAFICALAALIIFARP